MQPKYGSKKELCYMETGNFVYEIKTEDFYEGIAKDVEEKFDTSRYSKDDKKALPIGTSKKVIGMMKYELGGKIKTEFIALRERCTRIER